MCARGERAFIHNVNTIRCLPPAITPASDVNRLAKGELLSLDVANERGAHA